MFRGELWSASSFERDAELSAAHTLNSSAQCVLGRLSANLGRASTPLASVSPCVSVSLLAELRALLDVAGESALDPEVSMNGSERRLLTLRERMRK